MFDSSLKQTNQINNYYKYLFFDFTLRVFLSYIGEREGNLLI